MQDASQNAINCAFYLQEKWRSIVRASQFCLKMPSTDLLKQFGLSRNPFTDRTAEKTDLDTTSLYVHSDLQGFTPSGDNISHHPLCLFKQCLQLSSLARISEAYELIVNRDDLCDLWKAGIWENNHSSAGSLCFPSDNHHGYCFFSCISR